MAQLRAKVMAMLNALSLLALAIAVSVRNAHQCLPQCTNCGQSVGTISKFQLADGEPSASFSQLMAPQKLLRCSRELVN